MPRGLPGGYLLPEAKFKDFQQPAPTLARCEKPDHYTEWVRMCKAGKKSITPIEFACGLTEFALLGTLAQRRHSMPTPPPAGATGGRGGGGRGGRQRPRSWPGITSRHEVHQRRVGQQPGRYALPQGVGLQDIEGHRRGAGAFFRLPSHSVGQTIGFRRLSRGRGLVEPDRPRRSMVCPTSFLPDARGEYDAQRLIQQVGRPGLKRSQVRRGEMRLEERH